MNAQSVKAVQIILMTPHVVAPIWGGKKLASLKNLSPSISKDAVIGETWEVSDLPGKSSKIEGIPLNEFYQENRSKYLGDHQTLSYLIKFLDTSDNLSVQVHPGDEYAKKHENSSGKTECWIILDAKDGEGIYLGLNESVTKESFQKALEKKEDMSQLLKFYPVSRGDFFFVPSGTAHAIGKDVTLVEIQQSSGITYRAWDWNRVDDKGKGRELHVKQALDVLNFDPQMNKDETFLHQKDLFSNKEKLQIVEHYDFVVQKYSTDSHIEIDLSQLPLRAKAIVCLEGKLALQRGETTLKLNNYQTALLPLTGDSTIIVNSEKESHFLLVT